MMPAGAAEFIAAIYLLVVSLLGATVGIVTCVTLRLRWSAGVILIDAVIAPTVAAITLFLVIAYDRAYGGLHTGHSWLYIAFGVFGVVLRHVIRAAIRRSDETSW